MKAKRDQAKASAGRVREQAGGSASIDAVKIGEFAKLINEKLATGDVNVRRAYIGSVVDGIEVGDGLIRIVGRKDVLQAVIAGKNSEPGGIRGFVRKWRAGRNKTANTYVIEIMI